MMERKKRVKIGKKRYFLFYISHNAPQPPTFKSLIYLQVAGLKQTNSTHPDSFIFKLPRFTLKSYVFVSYLKNKNIFTTVCMHSVHLQTHIVSSLIFWIFLAVSPNFNWKGLFKVNSSVD